VEQSYPWELMATQLTKKFPAFYWTQKFIAVFARARHWTYTEAVEFNSQIYTLFF
jgi:hypothetical protein